jgi:isoprenylcysteine carboxyl methyltransferase (ICMT) family protein YpbQ
MIKQTHQHVMTLPTLTTQYSCIPLLSQALQTFLIFLLVYVYLTYVQS